MVLWRILRVAGRERRIRDRARNEELREGDRRIGLRDGEARPANDGCLDRLDARYRLLRRRRRSQRRRRRGTVQRPLPQKVHAR